jgi:PAS domain S-box-containing protein
MSGEVVASASGAAALARPEGDASAELLRLIADQSPAVMLVAAAPDFRIIYANAAAHRAARRPAGELLGRSAAAAFAFVDPVLMVTKTPAQARAVADRERGEPIWWDVSYAALDAAAPDAGAVLITAVDVTHHELAKAKAQAAHYTLDALLEYLPQGISIAHGPEVRVDRISARGAALAGRGVDDLAGYRALRDADVWEVYRPGGDAPIPPSERPLARATLTGAVTNDETLLVRRPDGELLTVVCNSGPIRDAEGRVVGAVVSWHDVGELQRAQAAMRESEKRLRAVLMQIPAAVIIVEAPDGRTTFRSRLVDEVLREPDVDMATRMATRTGWAVHEDGRPYELTDYPSRRALFSGESVRAEPMAFVRGDGQLVELEVHAGPIHGEGGDIIAAVSVAMDVTERRQAEAKLRDSEERLRQTAVKFETFAQTLPNMIWTSLPDGRIDWFNAKVCEYSGVLERDLKPDGWAPVHPDDIERATSTWRDALASGEPYEIEYRIRRHDGVFRWHITRAVPVRDADGTIAFWIGSSADIQDQKSSEQALADLNATLEEQVRTRTAELLEAEEALRQSQKMEAVGQLTGGLAHDFNNLLTGITGSLDLLAIRVAQGRVSELDRYLHTAQGAAKRAATLTHRLLAFSRRQTLDPKPTDVNKLIYDIDELIRRTVGPSVTVKVSDTPDLWTVLADPNQLENALLNLCINARDAMPAGGDLIIETGNLTLKAAEAKALNLRVADYVSLSVTDTGVGMTADVVARAFDPFFTTKPLGEGTGLGLSMVYGFARQSGGQARIYSEPGQGAKVCVYLPRYVGEGRIVEPSGDAPKTRASAGETVLVVDDEPSVRMVINDVLSELGYNVLQAEDASAGLKILESGVDVDLLVTDVGLPGGMNGRQLADAALVNRPNLKILFITGYAESAALSAHHFRPGIHVLTKPFSLETLKGRVSAILAAK